MSRGLGKVQKTILNIIKKQDLGNDEWLSIGSIHTHMDADKLYPHSKAQSIWRAIRRLETLGYVKVTKFNLLDYPPDRRRESDFRCKHIRLGDKRLVDIRKDEY